LGRGSERSGDPSGGQRLYVLGSLHPPVGVPGQARPATEDDVELVLSWLQGFERDTGGTVATADTIRRRLRAGLIWIWEHRRPVAMATYTSAAAGVSRVGLVYTPPDHRRHGYAAACTAAVTVTALGAGAKRCVLYTQLQNPQSNAIYRRLGYQPVSEHLRHEFAGHASEH
jgi:predicted GNAT family acetyltransferase